MVILSHEDLYQVKFASLIADYDRKTLIDLYMPIVGFTAISIYFTLWSEAEKSDLNMYHNHSHLLINMQMATGVFIKEKKKLEALGLLKTNIKRDRDVNFYTYQIYAPKTPEKFFSNSLLYGTLVKYIGEAKANKLRLLYSNVDSQDYGNDESATFASVFSPDFLEPVYKKALEIKKGEIIGRLQSKIDSEFNYDKFIDFVKQEAQISSAVFTKKLLKEVERLATLYGVNEQNAAECFAICYNPKLSAGKRVDFNKLTLMFQDESKFPYLSKMHNDTGNPLHISSDTKLAQTINLMEDVSCKEFLSYQQHGTKPVTADLNLVNDLSRNLGLNTAVINAIVYDTLQKHDNVLNRNYVEKIAASVAREKITTAYDTLVYLNSNRTKKTSTSGHNYIKKDLDLDIEEENKNDGSDNLVSDEEWEKMLKEFGEN